MSFLGEIKRRKVFQVAAVYAVAAWLTIQIIDVVGEPLNLPVWLDTVIIVLFAAGFPIAVILAWAFDVTPQGIKTAEEAEAIGARTRLPAPSLSYVMQGLVLVAVGFLVADQYLLGPSDYTGGSTTNSDSDVRRYSITLDPPKFSTASYTIDAGIALSHDGRSLAYGADVNGTVTPHLWRLDQPSARPIETPGDFDIQPFFSLDDAWLAFVHNDRLYKAPVNGGPIQSLSEDARGGTGAVWGSDGTIIFSARPPQGLYRLHRVDANGGSAQPLNVAFDRSEWTHTWPDLLPGETHLLYTIRPTGGNARDGRINLLSLETGETRTLIESGYNARYAPSGHIVFVRVAGLWAVPFDADRLQITGPEALIVDGVQTSGTRGRTTFSFSNNGRMIYLPGSDRSSLGIRRLVWVDREGQEELIDTPALPYLFPRLSPSGASVAATIRDETGNADVWIYDLESGNGNRVTFQRGYDGAPVWSPDGERLAFNRDDETGDGLWLKQSNNTGPDQQLTTSSFNHSANEFTPDGDLIFTDRPDAQNDDIYVYSFENEASKPLIQTGYAERLATVSPDGRFLAYTSNEGGAGDEIYVVTYPDIEGGKWQVSIGGGLDPRWGPNGRELFYRGNGTGTVMVVRVETEPTFDPGEPTEIIPTRYDATARSYDVSPDGQRFLMLKDAEPSEFVEPNLIVVENWFEDLKRLAPIAEQSE